jgi:hypothetical protein
VSYRMPTVCRTRDTDDHENDNESEDEILDSLPFEQRLPPTLVAYQVLIISQTSLRTVLKRTDSAWRTTARSTLVGFTADEELQPRDEASA